MKVALPKNILTAIEEKISSMRFGELLVVVHDGKVVQMEVKEKIRIVQ